MSDEIEKAEVVSPDSRRATINTVQHSVYVKRLAIPRYRNYNWYIPYDVDNLYPNKVKTIAERSVTATTAIETHADFLSGQGFGDDFNDIIVNDEGETLEEVLKTATNEYSTFKGVALHFNFDRLGRIVEINEIAFETLRWSKDTLKLLHAIDWSEIYNKNREVTEYDYFNPTKVVEQINEVGIDKYKGQVLYFIPRRKDIYTPCRFDHAINDAQFEDESSVFKLRGIQNDYAIGGLIKLPAPLFDDTEKGDVVSDLQGKSKGAKNALSWKLVPLTNEEHFKGRMFEPMVRQNVDSFHKNQNEQAKSNIYEAYQQPPILNGKSFDGMFNQDQFVDAFDYYNSKTQNERDIIERVFNKFWGLTIWSKGEKLEIIEKEYIIKRDEGGINPKEEAQS